MDYYLTSAERCKNIMHQFLGTACITLKISKPTFDQLHLDVLYSSGDKLINSLWLCLDSTLLKPDPVQAHLYSRDELIEIYKEFIIVECEQSLNKDDILKMERSVLHHSSKLLTFYVVCSMESSDRLFRKHGISKMDLHIQMCNLDLFNDYDVINMTVRFKTSACLKDNFIEGTNLQIMEDDLKSL